jgi:SAM-dependent methyltransferase
MNSKFLPPSLYDYLERPKSSDPNNFWDQVRRTVNGKPISEEQIKIMCEMIKLGCSLNSNDILLDLCCGNGKLGSLFFHEIDEYHGIDMSDFLIEIAKKNFEKKPNFLFTKSDLISYLINEDMPDKYTKCLIFGSIAYFSINQIKFILKSLYEKFTSIEIIYIGPIPDRKKAHLFYKGKSNVDLEDHTSSIGRWFEEEQFKKISNENGWNCKIQMNDNFYQNFYRFNAILER